MRKILDDNALLVVATGFAVLLTLLTLGAPKAQQTASGTAPQVTACVVAGPAAPAGVSSTGSRFDP